MKKVFAAAAIAAFAAAADTPDLWLGRGGFWRESAGITVFNSSANAWEGLPVMVKAGRGENELPVEGVRIEELRLVDGKGVELEYGVWSADGKTFLTEGPVPRCAQLVLPATCPAGGVASMRLHWNNPKAWGLADFWKKRPTAKDAKPYVHVCPAMKSGLREVGADAPWAPDGGRPWAYRIPLLIVNAADDPLVGVLASVPLAAAQRMLTNPMFALRDAAGAERPVFAAGGRVFFVVDVPARTALTLHLYARENMREMKRVKRAAASALGSEIPSDQVIVEETGMTKADEDALMRLIDSPANLLRNPSFEEGGEPEAGWTWSGKGAKGVVFSRDAGGFLGSHCARLEIKPDAKPNWQGRVQGVDVKSGRTYFYGAFVSGENLTGQVAVHEHMHDAKGKTLGMGATSSSSCNAGKWTPLFGTVSAGAEGRKMTLHLTMNGHGVLRHDGAMVVECVAAHEGDPEMPAMPQGAFAVRQFDVVEKVFRESPVEDAKGPFSIDLALNETEELQLAVRAGRRIARLEAEVAPLAGPGGAKLAVSAGYVDWVPVDHATSYYSCYTPEWVLRKPSRSGNCDGWAGWWPDPIVPKGVCELPANTARAFRFTVKTTCATPPGTYRGEVVWREDGRVVRRDKVEARVWGFALPERPTFAAIYDVRLGNAAWKALGDGKVAYNRVADFMAEKKICPDRVPGNPVFKRGKDGHVTADFAAYDAAAEEYFDKRGFPVSYTPGIFYCFGWGHPPKKFLGIEPYEGKYPYKDVDRSKLSPAWTAAYKEALSLYWRHMKEKGWDKKLVLYISDEPYMRDSAIEAQMKALCAVIHEVDPAIRIYCSTWRHLAAWEGSLDVWGVAHYGAFPVDVMKRISSSGGGKGIWFTTDGQECLDTVNCSTERLFPHYCAAWGAEAYEFWGCTWLTYDPWKFGWHSYIRQSGTPGEEHWVRYPAGDGYLIYPPKAGIADDVCSSVRLEAARDGVEDFSLLKALAARKDSAADALLAEFRALCPIPNPGGRYSGRNLPDPSRLAALRRRALELLGGRR